MQRLTLKSTRILCLLCNRPLWGNPLVIPVGVFTDAHSAGFWEWRTYCGSVVGQVSTVPFTDESLSSSSGSSFSSSVPERKVERGSGPTLQTVCFVLISSRLSGRLTSDPCEQICEETVVRAECGLDFGSCWGDDATDSCKYDIDCTCCIRNAEDFCGKAVTGCGERREFVTWRERCEIAGCVRSWDNAGWDWTTVWSSHRNDCHRTDWAPDFRTQSGRRYKCICSCFCSFISGLPADPDSDKVSLGSISSVFSCSCGGGDCLSQPARRVPKWYL